MANMDTHAPDSSKSRLYAQFIAEFMLRSAADLGAAFEQDYEAALLFLTVFVHNLQAPMLNPKARVRLGGFQTPLPDNAVRPMKLAAAARTLDLPGETIRRKATRLAEEGLLIRDHRGLRVPANVHEIPGLAAMFRPQEANIRRMFAMIDDGRRPLPVSAGPDPLESPWSRLLAFHVAEFILRMAASVARVTANDFVRAIVFTTISNRNTAAVMSHRIKRLPYIGFENLFPAELSEPVTRLAVARSSGLPRETVRRKAADLLEEGWIEELDGGLRVVYGVSNSPVYAMMLQPQAASLKRLHTMISGGVWPDLGAGVPA